MLDKSCRNLYIGIEVDRARFFIPPYEWCNETIVFWAEEMGLIPVNFTPGTYSNLDYTTPDMDHYLSSKEIYDRIIEFERNA